METLLRKVAEAAAKKVMDKSLRKTDPWEYDVSTPIRGHPISGTNGVEASADEVVAGFEADKQPGEWQRIADEISKDVYAGVSVQEAKRKARLRALDRRGLNVGALPSVPGHNTKSETAKFPYLPRQRN